MSCTALGGWLLTACSQGQACCAASDEVVQGVIWLLSDLGTDTGGKAKHSSNGSCKVKWGSKVGNRGSIELPPGCLCRQS